MPLDHNCYGFSLRKKSDLSYFILCIRCRVNLVGGRAYLVSYTYFPALPIVYLQTVSGCSELPSFLRVSHLLYSAFCLLEALGRGFLLIGLNSI